MKVLITGGNGFVAPYLVSELQSHGHTIVLTGREALQNQHKLPYFAADLTNKNQVNSLILDSAPDAVVHLAGISNVAMGQKDRAQTIAAANIDSTRFICEALYAQDKPSKLLFVSTGLVFCPSQEPTFKGFSEESALGPVNDYGWSKLAAEATVQLFESPQLRTFIVRPFNHIGPGQDLRFVCPSLAQKIISTPNFGTIEAGNLNAQRDFCDVRDIVKAYRLILEKQPNERIFVLGSGKPTPVNYILKFFLNYSAKQIIVETSPDLMRIEHDIAFGQIERAKSALAWEPTISLDKTLVDIYNHVAKQSEKV